MNNPHLITSDNPLPAELENEIVEARNLLDQAKSENTRLAYKKDWKAFSTWCELKSLPSLPSNPAVIVLYVNHLYKSGRKVSTIRRQLTTISQIHEKNMHNSPTKDITVRDAVNAVKRQIGTKPDQKQATSVSILKAICDQLPNTMIGIRDRAVLLVGMTGALRRSEIAALNVEDIQLHDQGMTILIPFSKTDQYGDSQVIGIEYGEYPYCPVRALENWLRISDITGGAVFRRFDKGGRILPRISDKSIAKIVKSAAKTAGFNPDVFSGHSLRRGLITSAKRLGIDEHDIMKHTRHQSISTMRRYIDESDVFHANNPTKHLWKST